jgi:hypothetical protein
VLRVTKKIATEAAADAILASSYKLSAPLGVPTLILDPADYDPAGFTLRALLREPLADRVARKMRKLLYGHYGRTDPAVRGFLRNIEKFQIRVANVLDKSLSGNRLTAHSFAQGNLFNVVICPATQDTPTLMLKHGLHMSQDKIPDMPGYNAQWNFIKLWHEFAHGSVGTSESQADQMAAYIHQHTFNDPCPLMAFSDFRAVQAVMHHERIKTISTYGWPLVDTIDQVLNADIPSSWDETVKTAKAPAPSDPAIADLQFIGRSLSKISKSAFTEPDILMLGMMSDHMAHKGNVENERQLHIARRFAIAAQRLSIGTTAYAVTTPKPSI